jgi:hypothetical protein
MSTARPHLAVGHVDQPAVPCVYTCNRLGRQATPLSRSWALADWWRRTTRRTADR